MASNTGRAGQQGKGTDSCPEIKNYTKTIQQTQTKITITSLPCFTYSSPIDRQHYSFGNCGFPLKSLRLRLTNVLFFFKFVVLRPSQNNKMLQFSDVVGLHSCSVSVNVVMLKIATYMTTCARYKLQVCNTPRKSRSCALLKTAEKVHVSFP